MSRKLQIAVLGSDKDICSDKARELAYETGKLIAQAGHILLSGGGHGVMEAACKGAYDAGGITVGILPGDKRQEGNGYLKIEIPTGMGFIARSQALINAADGVTAIQGGIGTLGELCQSNYQKVPSVALIGSGGTADLYSDKKLDARDREPVKGVNNPKEALDYLLARLAH